jgi:hypothetical protein
MIDNVSPRDQNVKADDGFFPKLPDSHLETLPNKIRDSRAFDMRYYV